MVTHLTNLLRALNQPLLVDPSFGPKAVSVFARKYLMGARFSGADLHAELGIPAEDDRPKARTEAKVAVIPVYGVISQRPASLGASTEEIGAMFDAAMRSRDVDAVLFDVDSPGGTVSGVPELGAKIYGARKLKPMLALSNSLAASAAYWIGSAAEEMWVTPSGEAGSIGVYTTHEDWSQWLKQEGIDITAISAGEFKLEGAPWEPLTEEAKAKIQEQVDEVYGWFVRAVATHRKDTQENVRAGYGKGRVLMAKQSVRANLVDRVGTIDEAIEHLSKRVAATRSRRAAAAVERERLAYAAAIDPVSLSESGN